MQKQRFVLMLEEDHDDRLITESALKDLGFDMQLKYAASSTEFFEQLKKEIKPSLLLLDFNSTPSPAIEILKELKGNKEYAHIPCVVLGEGLPEHLIQQCYASGANSYITNQRRIKLQRKRSKHSLNTGCR